MVEKDLRQKRVFLTGPRQVEKTHLAFDLLKKSTNGVYLNYDNLEELGNASLSANQGKKEVDFALAVEDQPPTIIEAKLSDSELAPSLRYFHEKYDLPAVQVVHHLRQERMAGKIAIRRALDFLRELKM